ncbi:MAG TPA: hypothetical protein VGN63_16760 [Flavisolibacter sp.]|jgi:hypothetical protein|nr:hypothetical protein [Flavisolibacter sp.]
MRLITVRTPAGDGKRVADIAFEKGVKEVAINNAEVYRSDEGVTTQDVVNIETATPIAKKFIEALMAAPFYDAASYSFTVRHPEALFGAKPPKEEIHPIVRPTTDVYEELYQFTKVTVSLVGRVFLSSVLLAYGMVEDFIPLVIAGLLFLPYHHHMIGLALGGVIKEWRFFQQAALALLVSTVLIFLAGLCVGLLTKPPLLFEIKGSPLSGALLAAAIGVAAGLGSIDDAGRRELIGLAATAHISIYPAWLGLQVVFGEAGPHKITEHLLSFLINVVTLIFAAIITYAVAGMQGDGIRKFTRGIIANRNA